MATRDDILQAFDELGDPKAGLTLQDLLPYCEACDHDEQIVASALARLCGEGKLRRDGFRAGENVYYRQATPRVDEPIERTREIAPMKTKLTIAERILKALAGGRPTSIRDLERASGASTGTIYATLSKLKQDKKARPVPGMRGMWELPAPTKPPAAAGKPKPTAKPAAPVNGARVGPVESDVPVPDQVRGPTAVIGRAIAELRPGQSRLLHYNSHSVRSAARRLKIKFTTRREGEACRIWRLTEEE